MRRIILLLTIASIITSCSTNAFLKRKYTSGMYIESVSQKRKTEKRENVLGKSYSTSPVTSKSFIAKENENVNSNKHELSSLIHEKNNLNNHFESSKTCQVSKKSSAKKTKTSIISTTTNYNNNEEYVSHFNYFPSWNKGFITKFNFNTAKTPSDEEKIIWIILALFPFINLIPIYLHDGKKVTTNFIVCLVLDLLFFFPGIIFALLVVLDIINLA